MATRVRKRTRRTSRSRRRPSQSRSKATVEAILIAAAHLFEERGLAGATTNRIAERAGVSVGSLYQYFPDKEALAAALLERHLAEGMRRLHEWVGRAVAAPATLRDTLRLFVDGIIALHAEQPRLQHVLLEETPLPPRLHDALLASEREAALAVAGLLRLFPEVRHPNLEHAAVVAVQLVESLTHRFAAHEKHLLAADDFARELVTVLEAYFTSAP